MTPDARAALARHEAEGAIMHLVILAAVAALAVPVAAQAQAPASPPGRLLASNCFQCHGTEAGAAGVLPAYSESAVRNEASTTGDIMNRHAAGYTDAQLKLIADYFATRR
jgi:sulfide dehydrogenase cytochrome subunit